MCVLTLSDLGYFKHLMLRGGGGARKLLYQSLPYHACAFYAVFYVYVPVKIVFKFAFVGILQQFQNK